ncbi:MAG: phosphoenolpyruvate synthase [Candidatus Lokiarchaeota archaeon]|nr:phosphoenolpyruvate synthase [Candidatus Lokiarchaeota archaeon]MBD3202504.1 phosphoenolpyruvate synthase [Candidatus Lokiarchaeota archaeon]
MTQDSYHYIKFFDDLRANDVDIVGGKNASLGELLSFGIPVPLGFAVTANAFDYVLESNDLLHNGELISLKEYIRQQIKKISEELRKEDIKSIKTVDKICANIRTHIEQAKMPDSLRDEIIEAYNILLDRIGDKTTFAVRSSATAEDLPDASFAGQQDTHLNINGEKEIVDYILRDMASVFTTRATAYRERAGFDHFSVKLSVGVQEMAGGLGGVKASGVMFTEDPDSGNSNVIIIRGTWGLGELIVQGVEKGDEFIVFKHSPDKMKIISKTAALKSKTMQFDENKQGTVTISLPEEKQRIFCLTEEQVLLLAEYAKKIRKHYQKRMDIEWALGNNDKVYIVQARPETVHSQKGDKEEIFYLIEDPEELKNKGIFIENSGTAIGRRIGYGKLKIIESINQAYLLEDGDILVTEETNPDWTSYMQNLGGVITERGGPTCHAAIVSRELNIAGIVGADNIIATLKERQRERDLSSLTIDCSEGEARIWAKEVEYDFDTIEFSQLPRTDTQVLVNLGIPKGALSAGKYPDGTGLARLEFIINDEIQVHPNALINYESLLMRYDILLEQRKKIERIKKSELHYKDPFNKEIRKLKETLAEIEDIAYGYDDKEEFYVEKLAEGIATIAAGVWKELPDGSIAPCIVRLSDFKTNEYANLLGGWIYEGDESNPMMGFRGCSRYVHEDFQNAFILELRAIMMARNWGLTNIIPMLPFCRSPSEAQRIEELMISEGLVRGRDGLKVFCMAEIPSNILLADIFCKYFDGFSIGSNDLTQLTYGVGRDNEKLIPLSEKFGYTANSEAIKRAISELIKTAHENGKKVGICGQAPSDFPDFLRFLVRESIDSISLNFDTFARGRINTWRTEIIEDQLKDKNKETAYKFLAECDDIIDRMRIPRGKLRNMVRKKRKEVEPKLLECRDQFDEIFSETQTISYEFVNEINSGVDNFEDFFKDYNSKIKEYGKTIPSLQRKIREFGIF